MVSRRFFRKAASVCAVLVVLATAMAADLAAATELQPLSISMEGYAYPYPVRLFPLHIEGEDLNMAYMDVPPTGADRGRTVVLLHGKNFFGAYWKETIKALAADGYRVIVPDQIGFGKSSKPAIHYSFHLLAANTKKLLDSLGIEKAVVVGHSMGGMLATRFALIYPRTVTHLVLEDPIGLEDYRPIVPYASPEELYRNEMKATEESIRAYQKGYYVRWRPEYDEYVQVAARWKLSAEYPRLAMASALTYEMIYEQPVCYEFPGVKAKTMLVIGQADRTVVGKARVRKELLPRVGQYPELGRKTARLIPGARLVEVPDAGHIPHFEARELFNRELLEFIR